MILSLPNRYKQSANGTGQHNLSPFCELAEAEQYKASRTVKATSELRSFMYIVARNPDRCELAPTGQSCGLACVF